MKKSFFLLFLACVVVGILSTLPVRDYEIYIKATRAAFLSPTDLYTDKILGFYCLPWTIFLLSPLLLLPDHFGQAVLNLLSLISVMAAIRILYPNDKTLAFVLALATPYLLSILYLGQWDAIAFGAAVIAYWAVMNQKALLFGLMSTIALTKPTNVFLLVFMLLLFLPKWNLRNILKASVFPVILPAFSFLIYGFDWIDRYISYTRQVPPFGFNISVWSYGIDNLLLIAITIVASVSVILFCKRKAFSPSAVALLLSVNLLISPYLTPYALISIVPSLAIVTHHTSIGGLFLSFVGIIAFYLFWFQLESLPLYFYVVLCFFALVLVIRKEDLKVPKK